MTELKSILVSISKCVILLPLYCICHGMIAAQGQSGTKLCKAVND